MAIEIVSFPMKNGGSFHSYVSLPEGSIPNKSGWNVTIHQPEYIAETQGHLGMIPVTSRRH